MSKRASIILMCLISVVTTIILVGTAHASIILNDFEIYWNASGDDVDDAIAIAETYIKPKLYEEAATYGIRVNNVTIKYKPLDSGYFYPWLNSDIQSDLDNGLITLKENEDITYGQVDDGYTWYYNNPSDSYFLYWYINDDDEIVRTYVFGAVDIPNSTVPIPSSVILIASGVGALVLTRRRKNA